MEVRQKLHRVSLLGLHHDLLSEELVQLSIEHDLGLFARQCELGVLSL